MPKKRIIGINEIPNTTKATSTMTFNIDASVSSATMFFNQGGYSFILEDAEGSRVRFWYVTSNGTQRYFKDDNDLQPRYLNEDPNQFYFDYDSSNPFFGENTSNNSDITNLFMKDTPVRINISDIVDFLTLDNRNNNSNIYKQAMIELVSRTARAINYVEEVKISATSSVSDALKGAVFLEQNIAGPDGNTQIDRNESADAVSLSFYGILTEDIETENFSGGAINPSTYENIFSERSGSLSNAIKKEINRKSFLAGFLPSNKIITGKKLIREDIFFDDSLTCIFEEKSNNNSLFGLPVDEATINGKEELFFKYSNINADTIYDTTENIFKNEQLLLRNTGIYSEPNDLNIQLFEKQIHSQKGSIDNFVEQKRVIEKYTPYEEDFGYFTATDSDFETTNLDNNENYNIKNQKQIKISLNFPDVDAYLVNTAIAYNDIDSTNSGVDNIHYTEQINFLNGNKKAVSSNSFPTAYWNFVDNRWEYLDIKSKNISPLGYVNPPAIDTNYVYKDAVFPASVNNDSFSINNGEYDFRESVKNNLLNRPICLTPSFRDNNNDSFLMQPTTSYGFPQKVNWQPHNNHIIKMSDYISENFIVEKIIVKGKLSANFEKPTKIGNYGPEISNDFANFQEDYSLKQLSNEYLTSEESLGFSFFILNQRKNADVVNKKALINSSAFYTEALKTSFDPSNILTTNSNNVYSESIFINKNVSPTLEENGLYQFENKHLDFYNINSNNNLLKINENLKNKFYYFSPSEVFAANSYTQFLCKDISEWSESNYDEDLTNTTSVKKFNITDAYNDGVSQEEVSRELVSFSNLLLINNSQENITSINLEKLKNIDEIIYISDSSNSVENLNFTINSNLKNYNSSNFIDESKYSLLSNKTNTYLVSEGVPSDVEFQLLFDYDFFNGTLDNFKSNLAGFSFRINLPDRFEIHFSEDPDENNFIYIKDANLVNNKENHFNLSKISDSIWKTESSHPGENDVSRASFNFIYFVLLFIYHLNNNLDELRYYNNTAANDNLGRIYINSVLNTITSDDKILRIIFEAKDNDTQLFTPFPSPAGSINLQPSGDTSNSVLTSIAIKNTNISIPDTNNTDILSNNINILEGYSNGKENFVGINTERIIKNKIFDKTNINSYTNNINYSFFNENTNNSIINTNYLLKPEDELVFGINSYGNGDLITSLLQLHNSLDITIVGRTQHKEEIYKTNESHAINKVIKESNRRKTNIEGSYLTKNNYFSNIYSTKDFSKNKRIIGQTSSNDFNTWGGFINLEESNSSLLNSYKNYFYDSILPNFVDVYSNICNKLPATFTSGENIYFIRYILDDENVEANVPENSDNVLFKENWLEKYIFNNFQNFEDYRNIDNTINGSIDSSFSNIERRSFIDIRINKESYRFDEETISSYTLPVTNDYNTNDILPLKIYNNENYDFIDSDSQIILDLDRINEESNVKQVLFSIQKPRYFDKWILVIHDFYENLKESEYPIYNSFKTYLEQGNNDYEEVSTVGINVPNSHLISKRSIPLTIFSAGEEVYFSKDFKIFYGTDDINNFVLDDVKAGDHSSVTRRTFFAELEYWEILYLQLSGFNELSNDDDRPDNLGGQSLGFPRSSSVYNESNFVTSKIQKAAFTSNQILETLGDSNWETIYNFEETISDSNEVFYETVPEENICSLSISKYKLTNPQNSNRDFPVLKENLSINTRYKDNDIVRNSIQTYVNKKYLEDNISDIINFEEEFEDISFKNDSLIANEKIYESEAYYISPILNNDNSINSVGEINSIKTDVKFIYKYIKNDNNLNFPYIKVLGIKSNNGLLNAKFTKSSDSIFLPKHGKIRVYEPDLLDLSRRTNIISLSDVPYFEIRLYKDESNQIPFGNDKLSTFSFNELINRCSRIFTIKNNNETSDIANYLYDTENFEQYDSFDDRDRKINNFIYSFGRKHHELPYKSCKGFKFGVLNGHKTSPSYKFSAYSYGQFADFIAYSTNAAYVRKNPKTNSQLIEYPVQKVFVDNYYNVVSSSSNTFNNNVHSSCSYPYIENVDNELSQLNSNNSLYNAENVY